MPIDDRPMRRIGDLLKPKRQPTREEAAAIAEVRDLATEWDAGRLPIEEVERLSSGQRRWLATRFTPPDHPAFGPLMRLLDALIPRQAATARHDSTTRGPVYRTKHGLVHDHDLRDAEARIERTEEGELVVFPVRYPWKVKPDREKGTPGVRLPAVYRSPKERGPEYDEFRAGQKPKPLPREGDDAREWWDE